jgi:hypothetical protein
MAGANEFEKEADELADFARGIESVGVIDIADPPKMKLRVNLPVTDNHAD